MTNTAGAANRDPAIVSAGRITHRPGSRIHLAINGTTFCGSGQSAQIVRPLTSAAVASHALCLRCFTAQHLADANRAHAMSATKDTVVTALLARNPVAETAVTTRPNTPARASVLAIVASRPVFVATSGLCRTCAGGLHGGGGCPDCNCRECSTPAVTYRIAA